MKFEFTYAVGRVRQYSDFGSGFSPRTSSEFSADDDKITLGGYNDQYIDRYTGELYLVDADNAITRGTCSPIP
jgi:hypothetical protein